MGYTKYNPIFNSTTEGGAFELNISPAHIHILESNRTSIHNARALLSAHGTNNSPVCTYIHIHSHACSFLRVVLNTEPHARSYTRKASKSLLLVLLLTLGPPPSSKQWRYTLFYTVRGHQLPNTVIWHHLTLYWAIFEMGV